MEKQIVIELKNVHKSFGSQKVLSGFNLDVKREENVVVLGRSGSGKSVLLKCIVGLILPDEGTITVLGQQISKLDAAALDALRSRIGFIFQSNALYDSMTVGENLMFPLKKHAPGLSDDEIKRKVAEALADVRLAHTAAMMPAELSGGMAKRIALARAMILKPEIMCYDEPTSGLDPITAREIEMLILELKKKYKTSSILISHDMGCVKHTADRIVLLLAGQCYAQGTFNELSRSKDQKVKQFFQ